MIQCEDFEVAWELCTKLIGFHPNDVILLLFMSDIIINLDKPIDSAIQILINLKNHIEKSEMQTFQSEIVSDNLFNELVTRKKLKVTKFSSRKIIFVRFM